jgi:putative RecB family exonuclease
MNTAQLPDHLSYSQIQCYQTCSLKYRFAYVDGLEPEFTAASLHFGTGIHQAVAAFLESVLNADHLTPDNLMDVFRDAWRKPDVKVRYFARESENSLLEKAKELIAIYHSAWDYQTEVLAGEEYFELDLPKLVPDNPDPLPSFVGYIDSIEKASTGEITIVDVKTAAKKPSDYVIQNNGQLTGYLLGATNALGFSPDEITFRLDYLMKTAQPDVVRYQTIRTEKDCRRFLKTITRIWRGINQGVFYPVHDWHCQQCSYSRECSDW